MMCTAMAYFFTSLTFDLKTQLKGQILPFCDEIDDLTLKVKVKVKDQ